MLRCLSSSITNMFNQATWKLVSLVTAKVLEKASDRVVDIQADDPEDDEEEDDGPVPRNGQESRKER